MPGTGREQQKSLLQMLGLCFQYEEDEDLWDCHPQVPNTWARLFLGGGCRYCSIGVEGRETGGGSGSLCLHYCAM